MDPGLRRDDDSSHSLLSAAAELFYLDELDRLAARAFDHDRAGVAEPVGLLEKGDAFVAQLADPGVEIADAEPDMVLHLATAAGKRLVALVHVPGQHDVAELDAGARRAEHAFAVERRPGTVGAALHPAIIFAQLGVGKALPHRPIEGP